MKTYTENLKSPNGVCLHGFVDWCLSLSFVTLCLQYRFIVIRADSQYRTETSTRWNEPHTYIHTTYVFVVIPSLAMGMRACLVWSHFEIKLITIKKKYTMYLWRKKITSKSQSLSLLFKNRRWTWVFRHINKIIIKYTYTYNANVNLN